MALTLLLQGCATTNVVTTSVPGKELSKVPLGEREVDSKIVMEELDTLSVRLFRRVSKAEYTRTEYQAIKEVRHETTRYNCSGTTYREYISILVVNLMLPLLYEFATNFRILHDMCNKIPGGTVIKTAETDQTLSRDSFDNNSIKTVDIPLSGEPVTAQLYASVYSATTSPAGIADFSANNVIALQDIGKDTPIKYQFAEVSLVTTLVSKEAAVAPGKVTEPANNLQPEMEKPVDLKTETAGNDVTDNTAGINSSGLSPEKTDTMAMLDEQSAAKKSARQEESETDPSINALSGQSAPNAMKPEGINGASEKKSDSMALVGEQSAAETTAIQPEAKTDSNSNAISGRSNLTANKPAETAESADKKSGSMALVSEQSAAVESAPEKTGGNQENYPPNMDKTGRRLNKPWNYTNEDTNMKITRNDNSIKIRNKSDMALTVNRIALVNNGRISDNLLSSAAVIPPGSESTELNSGNIFNSDGNALSSFGMAATYQAGTVAGEKLLSRVNRYGENEFSEDAEETARLNAHIAGMATKSAANASADDTVSIGATIKTDRSSKPGEWKIVLQVKFDTNKATIKKEYYPRLKEIGEALKSNERLIGIIEGHTDNVGSKEINQRISFRRAEAIAQHLTSTFGIAPERLKIEGYGMTRPIADNSTPNGRKINRRIEAKFKEAD